MPDTIVLIHGAFVGPWCMDNYQGLFRDRGWEVHAPGLRYHDGNPKADPDPALTDTSILDYTKDVATLSGALTHRRLSSGMPLARSLLRRLRPKASPAALR